MRKKRMVCTHRLYFLYRLLCFVLFWGRMFLYPGEHPAAAHSGQFRFTGRPGLKLKIRDAVLSCSGELFSGCDTRQKMISAAQEQLPKIQQVAEQTALHNGYELPVTVSVTDMFFETRRYDHVILPAGTYTAVRIELGAAAGKTGGACFIRLCASAQRRPVLPRRRRRSATVFFSRTRSPAIGRALR